MDRKSKAAAAVRLLKHCEAVDDQACADFLLDVVNRDQLFRECCADEGGEPFASMQAFCEALEKEAGRTPPTASAGRHNPPRLTAQERRAERLARQQST